MGAQPDIPLTGNFKNNQEDGKKSFKQDPLDKGESDATKPENNKEIHLSDILKPTTLIFGIISLVVVVLAGWYILVLKPALKDNESMIHFITPGIAPLKSEKGLAQSLPTESVVKLKPAISETSKIESNNIADPASSQAETQPNEEDNAQLQTPANEAGANKIASTKTGYWKKYKNHKHRGSFNQHNLKSSNFNSPAKCTQAQIALHQCTSTP